MLTPEQIAYLRDRAGHITDPVNKFLIEDIARRVSEAGQFTSSAAYQAWRALNLGMSQKEIKKQLKKLLKKSSSEIKQLLTQSADVGYDFDILKRPYAQAVPFEENATVQQIVSAAVDMAKEDFTNITQTLGFVTQDGQVSELTEAYNKACDFAFEQVATGAADYNTAIREATENLAAKGVRTIDYESGVHTSLEAAVRRNIMGGLGLMQERISRQNHDDFGCDGWEISAHANSAPDHEPIQGRQYSDADYEALNNSLVRRIGTLNCGHSAFPIILGVDEPQYTEEELRKLREENEKGVTVDGKHYTGYEATQMQRRLERAIRTQKRKILVDETTGDTKKLQTDQVKLQVLCQRYKNFSEAAGLRTENERTYVAGFGRGEAVKAVEAHKKELEKYSSFHYNEDGTIVVTDDWTKKLKSDVPRVYKPYAVIETKSVYRNGVEQIDRTIYGNDAVLKTQIHSGPHNRPNAHQFGENGEHGHTYVWDEHGNLIDRTPRELTDIERIEHADILKGDDDERK